MGRPAVVFVSFPCNAAGARPACPVRLFASLSSALVVVSRPRCRSSSRLGRFELLLEGIDPRGGLTPAAAPLAPAPSAVAFARAGAVYQLDFSFPDAYRDSFDFILERSDGLGAASFTEVPSATALVQSAGRLRFQVPAAATSGPRGFFRVRVRLRDADG